MATLCPEITPAVLIRIQNSRTGFLLNLFKLRKDLIAEFHMILKAEKLENVFISSYGEKTSNGSLTIGFAINSGNEEKLERHINVVSNFCEHHKISLAQQDMVKCSDELL